MGLKPLGFSRKEGRGRRAFCLRARGTSAISAAFVCDKLGTTSAQDGLTAIKMYRKTISTIKAGASALAIAFAAQSASADFNNFSDLSLGSESYWNGSDGAGMFETGGLMFGNLYNPAYASWGGWAYSNITNNTTAGYGNQYSAITGGGVDANGNTVAGGTYAVAFQDIYNNINPSVDLDPSLYDTLQIDGVWLTNSTYAYMSMLNGDYYAKKFGGASGTDADWFYVTITGYDSDFNVTGTYDYYLADFRFEDSSSDYILSDWDYVDLDTLGFNDGTISLTFEFASSDTGAWGINTPTFLALGGVVTSAIPEPATMAAISGLFALLFCLVRKRRKTS